MPPAVVLALAERLDTAAAPALAAELAAQRGRPVVLDAERVERLGGLCLQALLAARRAWEQDGQGFRIDNPSPAFRQALAWAGAHGLER